MLLTLDSGLSLTHASGIYSFQYLFAICGKISAGLLVQLVPRRLLFAAPPFFFCFSHLILLELAEGVDVRDWRAVVASVAVTRSAPRLVAFAIVYGSSFGLTHSLLTVQPVHLFGRVHLPYFQTLLMAFYVIGVSAGQAGSGWLYDASGERYGPPLLITFAVSAANFVFCQVLGGARGFSGRGPEEDAPRANGRCNGSSSPKKNGLPLV